MSRECIYSDMAQANARRDSKETQSEETKHEITLDFILTTTQQISAYL